MRKKLCVTTMLMLSFCGCSSMNNTEKGMLGGAAVGTGAGALLTRGHPVGMLFGGLVGTMVGGAAGNSQDYREDRRNQAVAIANERARNQMSLNDVVQLAQRGTADDIIIRQMDSTGSVFSLTTQDLTYLQDQNVSGRVISAMQSRTGRTVIVQPREVIYAPPPPPVYIEPGVSVGIRGRF